jgi:tripartite-type tricarboxylate transporter receptor subunit TctC
MFGTRVGAAGAVRGGKVRALAVTTRTRTPEMPELPTMIESGFPTYAMSGWFGIVAPKAVPRPIVERLARDINAILAEPEVVGEYAKAGIVVRRTASPDEFASFFSSQIEQFKSIIAKSGMKVETN